MRCFLKENQQKFPVQPLAADEREKTGAAPTL
jgi:hypothetical protein